MYQLIEVAVIPSAAADRRLVLHIFGDGRRLCAESASII